MAEVDLASLSVILVEAQGEDHHHLILVVLEQDRSLVAHNLEAPNLEDFLEVSGHNLQEAKVKVNKKGLRNKNL